MSDVADEKLRIQCACGAGLKVNKSAIGRKAKCPKCARTFVIKSPQPAAPLGERDPIESDPDSLLDEVAKMERTGAGVDIRAAQKAPAACPHCHAALPADARLCVACGFNLQEGRLLKMASPRAAAVAKLTATTGRFFLGTVLSGLGAIIGAGVWFAAATWAEVQIGWIAWGVGLLAGGGMVLGYRDYSARAGVVAAGMATFGILLAKVMIFVFVIYILVTGNTDRVALQRHFLTVAIADESLDEQGVLDEAEREERWESEIERAKTKVAKLSDDEVRVQTEERRRAAETEAADFEARFQRDRLAAHRAARRAEALNLDPYNEKRIAFYNEERDRCAQLTGAQLAEELEALESWKSEGRWADEAYVRYHLIDQMYDQDGGGYYAAYDDPDDEGGYRSPEYTDGYLRYKSFSAQVHRLTPQERLEKSQALELEWQQEENRARLARHRAWRRAQQLGLAYMDESRESIEQEEEQRAEALTPDELDKAVAELDAWAEGGQWSDEDYVRNDLIYKHIDRAIARRAAENDEYWVPTPEEWKALYDQAAAEVDAIPAAERAQRAKQIESAQEREWEDEMEKEAEAEVGEARKKIAALFFRLMFGPIDILFFLLALGTAFRLGNSGFGGVD